jgi:hypothetical protein
MKSARTPNPAGKAGKPISLSNYSFEDVVRKALSTPVPSKQAQEKKTNKRQTKKSQV